MPRKRRDILWLFLPALLLAAFGVYLSRLAQVEKPEVAGPHDLGPFYVTTSAVPVPLSPLDLAEGFDTKYQLYIRPKGKRHYLWGSVDELNNTSLYWAPYTYRLVDLGTGRDIGRMNQNYILRGLRYDHSQESYYYDWLFALSKLKTNNVQLRASLKGEIMQGKRFVTIYPEHPFTITPKKGQLPAPMALKYCPLRIAKLELLDIRGEPVTPRTNAFKLLADIHSTEPLKKKGNADRNQPASEIAMVNRRATLIDEAGRHHRLNIGHGWSINEEKNLLFVRFFIHPHDIPPSAKNAKLLKFHARLSVDERWPLTIEKVLFDKRKKADKKL